MQRGRRICQNLRLSVNILFSIPSPDGPEIIKVDESEMFATLSTDINNWAERPFNSSGPGQDHHRLLDPEPSIDRCPRF